MLRLTLCDVCRSDCAGKNSETVYGTADPKTGACGSLYNIVQDDRLNHRVEFVKGILEPKCSAILEGFLFES